jgi:hypothetical protein
VPAVRVVRLVHAGARPVGRAASASASSPAHATTPLATLAAPGAGTACDSASPTTSTSSAR